MAWKLISRVPNPWGEVAVTDDGRSITPKVKAYMDRIAEVATKRDCVSRRHHYVPQSYLRAWSPDGKRVRVLDTRNGIDKLRGLRDTCVQENFYRVTDPKTGPHNQVEAMLGVIDDETAVLLEKLRSWKPGDDVQFGDFMSLSVVMGLQRNRTPQARRQIASMEDWSTRRAGQPAQELTTDYYVDVLFRAMYKAADQISLRQLELWDDPQDRFITCDQPVLFSRDGSAGTPSMLTSRYVWWPISPHRLIAFSEVHRGQKVVHRVVTRREVDEVRTTFIRGAESAIIALPEDRDLPAGKRLHKRPQLQVECQRLNVRECGLHLGWGSYGTGPLDKACQPLCAVAALNRHSELTS
ncbi:DUF4238 domain-containing protein [Sphaerisporangium viridialbum]|uniref:DUF4238 domain-containing protein n=1 Tax=Sphaerisporangium viridialbum TaxID=46189 RepID=UPI003C78A1CD